MAALDLDKHFGREDIKIFEINEYNISHTRLFYRSTGTGNVKKFGMKFSGLVVPFYGTKDNRDKTLIKGEMKRTSEHGGRTLFEWQLELMRHLKNNDVDSDTLEEMFTLLDTYFNTPTELSISIERGGDYWNRSQARIHIVNFLRDNLAITPESYRDVTTTNNLSNNTYKLHNIDTSNLKYNWKRAHHVVTTTQYEERLRARFPEAGITKKGAKSKKGTRAKKGTRSKKGKRAKKCAKSKKVKKVNKSNKTRKQ